MFARGAQGAMSIKRRKDSAKKAKDIRINSPSRRQCEKLASKKIQTNSEKSDSLDSEGILT